MKALGIFAAVCFVGTVVVANWLVDRFGVVPVGFGQHGPAAVYVVGVAFVLRDVVHETFGRWGALACILLGSALSLVVSPAFAVASATAFLLSELLDLAVYSPLRERNLTAAVLASNAVGLVVDSVVFLWLAFGSLAYLTGQVVGKSWATLAALLVLLAWRGRRAAWNA